ncbi:MAG TPA: cytochrome C [Desulfuromonas sp.]|nr:cytochrome C [Desulfuromonas sp.]HBT83222.1 cytochrome C [Desulfuromonas sp.]
MKLVAIVFLLMFVGVGSAAAMSHGPTAEKGKALFSDVKLGTSGQSCSSCHPDGRGMAKAAVKTDLAETINTCIVKALKGTALDTKSVELQSMVLYIQSLGKM